MHAIVALDMDMPHSLICMETFAVFSEAPNNEYCLDFFDDCLHCLYLQVWLTVQGYNFWASTRVMTPARDVLVLVGFSPASASRPITSWFHLQPLPIVATAGIVMSCVTQDHIMQLQCTLVVPPLRVMLHMCAEEPLWIQGLQRLVVMQ